MKVERHTHTGEVLQRLIPPLAMWVVGKVLDHPALHRASEKVDARAVRRLRTLRGNLRANRRWVAASVVAFAAGIGLMARAGRR